MRIGGEPFRLYLPNAVLLAAGILAVSAMQPLFPAPAPYGLATFIALGVATNLFVIPRGNSVISLSDAVFLATAVTLGPFAAALVAVISITAGTLNLQRTNTPWRRLSQMIGNMGMYMLMLALASALYVRLGAQWPLARLTWPNYLVCLGFIVVYQLINRAIMYTRMALRGVPLRPELIAEREDMPIEVLNLHVGIPIALLYSTNGFGPLVFLGAFILFVSIILRRRVAMLQQLENQVTQLAALNEIGRAISANLDARRLMQAVYRESSRVIDTTNFYIALYAPDTDEVTFILNVTDGQLDTTPFTRRGKKALTEHVIHTRAPLLLSDRVVERAQALGIEPAGRAAQCWLGVPMLAGDQVMGMLAAQNYARPGAFTPEHVNILMTIAAQAAVALQNTRLIEALAEQERIKQELALARQIQQNLLPSPPQVPGLFIAGLCQPAQETGGDLFDFFPIGEHGLGIVIGDVTGKGMPAALLMATVRSALRAQAAHDPDPARVLGIVNRFMVNDTQGKTYVTLVYGVLDTRAWTLTLANAGHLSPLLCGEHHTPLYLDAAGRLPLGLETEIEYVNQTCALQPGQALLLYTDGVVEARNARAQFLGFERLQDIVAHQPGERLIETVLARAAEFTGPLALEDDLTLVVIQRQAR